jgi:1-hydroxycarotenoid 3,4-desaturase
MDTGSKNRVVVVGAGMGGLSAAVDLARAGVQVTVVEKAARAGGKMREVNVAGRALDAGPTVLTMRWVFDELFAVAGRSLERYVRLYRPERVARHAWAKGATLDLFTDIERSADAIGDFAGASEARGYREFCAYAKRIYEAVEVPFLRSQRPTLSSVLGLAGSGQATALAGIDAFRTMWSSLGRFFRDARLRQLFGRYATYCGSSPFRAPATFNLVAHVERDGVWLVEGGMFRIAEALERLARELGVTFRYGEEARGLHVRGGRVQGVVVRSGEVIGAESAVVNADPGALASGMFGAEAARAVGEIPAAQRSLSAFTIAMVGRTEGFPLARHNVLFSSDYEAEFRALFERRCVPSAPTVYVCAEDREASAPLPEGGGERLFAIVNAPANGDSVRWTDSEVLECERQAMSSMAACGLRIFLTERSITTPRQFEELFPGSTGALYGRVSHGMASPFQRPAARTKLRGLYLTGGGAHPGAGVPMAILSGRLASEAVLRDLVSTRTSRTADTPGSMWTP